MAKSEIPSEPFKRAVAAAVRALAGEPEMEVNFSSEPPNLKGLQARLPAPTRSLPPHEVAFVRGTGDAYALRQAYHDETIDARYRPSGADSNAIFEAAETARVEAIGALAMEGVGQNLAARLEQRLVAKGLGRAKSREDASLAEVVALLIREKLTGQGAPASLTRAVELWRPFVEERAAKDIAKLKDAMRDQRAFARLTRIILGDLVHGEDAEPSGEADADSDSAESQSDGEDHDAEEAGEAAESESDRAGEDGEESDAELSSEQLEDLREADQADEATRPNRSLKPFADTEGWGYKVFTAQYDE
ncbi:MAG: cobaltochelatase subunit CobT, partial [Rhizomicrobium sp.]